MGKRKSNSGKFKKGERRSPRTEFKKGHITWNKGKKGVMPPPWNKGTGMSKEEQLVRKRKSSAIHRQKNRGKLRKDSVIHYQKNRKKITAKHREENKLLKTECMSHYSHGKIHCLHCGITETDFLTIDHIKGRASVGHDRKHRGMVLYKWLKNHDYPNGFQVLCWNWNQIKTKKENEINRSMSHEAVRKRKFAFNDKVKALTKYSKYQKPKCNCCGYDELDGLTIDHIEGRRNIKQDENKHGDKLYRLLRHKGYPKGFSTLCFNCNSAKGESGKCPHEK